MSAASKSLFTNSIVSSNSRSLYNPILQNGSEYNDMVLLNSSFMKTLQMINDFYGKNMASKNYESIPNSYSQYVNFYTVLQRVIMRTKNPQLRLLFQIAQETLVGAINSYTIYGDNLLLKLDKTYLQNKVNDILSNKNEKLLEVPNATGSLSIKKSFRLAPIFNNYILIYGCPPYGAGFDPDKIQFLTELLNKNGIKPYG